MSDLYDTPDPSCKIQKVSESLNIDDLSTLTYKILKSPYKFQSSDFIKAYNIIYLHCTENSLGNEIKGSKVYTLLETTLISHFKSIRSITSIKFFYDLITKLSFSLSLIKRVYSYLSRYFIKVNLYKREEYVMTISSLFYNLLYKYGLYTSIKNVQELIIFEIKQIRGSINYEPDYTKKSSVFESNFNIKNNFSFQNSLNFKELHKCVEFIELIFINTDRKEYFIEFIDLYYKSFEERICNCVDAHEILYAVYYEIYICEHVFAFKSKTLFFPITSHLTSRFKEFINLIYPLKSEANLIFVSKDKINSIFCKFYTTDEILIYFKDKFIVKYFDKFKQFIFNFTNEIVEINKLFLFYVELSLYFNKSIVISLKVQNQIELFVAQKFVNLPNVNISQFFTEIIEIYINTKDDELSINEHTSKLNTDNICCTELNTVDLTILIKLYKDKILQNIFHLINLMPDKQEIINFINKNTINRIINNSDLVNYELKVVEICEKECGASTCSWLKNLLIKYKTPETQYFGLKYQKENFKTELRFLTKSFCEYEIQECITHPSLYNIQNILITQARLKYPRSYITSWCSASYIDIELNGYNLRLGVDMVSILMHILDNSLIQDIRNICKININYNINFLIKNNIIIQEGQNVYINKSYNNNIDISLYHFLLKKKPDVLSLYNAPSVEISSESIIMKYMKVHKKKYINSLKNEICKTGLFQDNLEDTLAKLQDKGYIFYDGEVVEYIP